MKGRALFPGLLGEGFASLHPHVRAVHSGESRRWAGRASVRCGAHPLARVAARIARLPSSQCDAPALVSIEARDGKETWTRHFGDAAPMRSTLCNRHGWLVERMGPLSLAFQVNVQGSRMHWYLQHVALLGVPLPRRLFKAQACVDSTGMSYRFLVEVSLAGIGELIRYDGELDVAG
jgi:hypothetical protein